jgi:hypothetical protein
MMPIYVAVTVICACVAVAAITLFLWYSNNSIKVTRYDEEFENAPEKPIKILHLSDLHAKLFGKDNKKLVAICASEKPDFIAFTGDIIHRYDGKGEEVAVKLIESLVKIAPVFYVSGNHEMRSSNFRRLKEKLVAAGAAVLDNSSQDVCGIRVCGLNCAHLKNNTIFALTAEYAPFKLLLAHEPQYISRYALAGVDLVLSGHAHGGQWRIPFTHIGIYAPGQGLFPEYTSDTHICGKTRMIISRGLGNSEFPFRLFNRPEVVVITIAKQH